MSQCLFFGLKGIHTTVTRFFLVANKRRCIIYSPSEKEASSFSFEQYQGKKYQTRLVGL